MRDSILHCLVGCFIAHRPHKFFGAFLRHGVIRAVPVFMPGPCPLDERTGGTRQKIAHDIRALLDLRVQGANGELVEAIERLCRCHDTHPIFWSQWANACSIYACSIYYPLYLYISG